MASVWIINGDYGKWRGRGNPEKFIDRREIALIGDNTELQNCYKKGIRRAL